jgi:peptide-methionine (S)-S-oxide reductase
LEKKATFGAGCFWGVEAAFRRLDGVSATRVGYAGGRTDNPSYQDVCYTDTGHAEVVEVTYDEDTIPYEALLATFWAEHDPTQLNRQGPDVGTQYRSAVFYTTEDQKKATEAYIDPLNKAHIYPRAIVTEVKPSKSFYVAEAYHQNYAELHPDQPYIAINDAPKVANLRKQFPELYTDKLAAHD